MKHASGAVTLTRQAQEGPLEAGHLVEGGDVLTTREGRCSLTLIDGARVALGPQSVLTLTQFQWDPTTRTGASQTHLAQGKAIVSAGGIAAASPQAMQVTTPRSRILVQATTIAVEVTP